MIESSWDDCINTSSARKVSADPRRAESLIETAEQRISLIKVIDEKNCNFVFEDYYTSLLELMQALTFKKGFNILNHICLGYYLRDILDRDDLYLIFDDLRYKRNSLTYYGSRMEFPIAQDAIKRCKSMIKEIRKLL